MLDSISWIILLAGIFSNIFLRAVCDGSNFPKELCQHVLTECHCYDFLEVAGIDCWNGTDFSPLSGDTLFPSNTTYEITIRGVRTVDRGVVKGLIVYRLFLDDVKIEAVDSNVFEGVFRLRRFHVRKSSIKRLPDFSLIRDSFRNLNLDNSGLTFLGGGSQLHNLPLLKYVSFVNNSISTIAPDTFQGTNAIQIFDVSHNKIYSLPPHLFDNWTVLQKVVLSHNHLLHVDHLFSIAHPQYILLDHNNLTDLDSIFYPNMTGVETVQLSYNEFTAVSSRTFNGKTPNIRFLYMDHCLISEFDNAHYAELYKLATLDLSYNKLTEIKGHNVSFGFHVELHFTGNQISTFEVELTFNVRRLYLNNNSMSTLGPTLHYSQMTEVSLAENQLTVLTGNDFKGVHETQVLDFRGNQLTRIDSLAFETIRNDLVYLDLSRNQLKQLGGCVRYLSLLTSLNLTENQIETFDVGEFSGLNELTEIYLDGNRIVSLGDQLMRLPRLEFLVVSRNRITTIFPQQIPKNLKFLYYADNPFRCDCALYPFLDTLTRTNSPGTDVPLCSLTNTTSNQSSNVMDCPEACTCKCASAKGDHYMNVDCGHRNLTVLPWELTEDNSTTITLELPRSPEPNIVFSTDDRTFYIEDSIGGIDLTGNRLLNIDGLYHTNLRTMLLADNDLKQLPSSVTQSSQQQKLRSVTMAGNPWKCDCGTIALKKWISMKEEIIPDVNDIRCSKEKENHPDLFGEAIITLTDIDLCPSDVGLYVSIAFGILSIMLLIAGMKITWMRYELDVKSWLYAHGFKCVKEKDIDSDKENDAFMSYCDKDAHIVENQLIYEIERKKPNIRICHHRKDFKPGDRIDQNIKNFVQTSKRTVLILSKNFLESRWCLMEFHAASLQSIEDNVKRIIIIKMGDLPEEIPEAIQCYMDSTTYLIWGEKYFWNKLIYALPCSESTTAQLHVTTTKDSPERECEPMSYFNSMVKA